MARYWYAVSEGWGAKVLRFASRAGRDEKVLCSPEFKRVPARDTRVRRTLKHHTCLLPVGSEYNVMPMY